MIDLKLIYELYIEHINVRLNKLLTGNELHLKSHKNLTTLLKEYEHIIQKYSSTSLEVILGSRDRNLATKLKFPLSPVFINGKQVNFKVIQLYVEKYVWCNNIIISNRLQVKELNQNIIDYRLYYRIITMFNKAVATKILKENYLFNLVPSFGNIGVIHNYNEHKRVNWGVSNKNKAKILADGGIPYIMADAEAIPNYKGIKWLEYHPPLDVYLHWGTKWITKELNPYLKDYKYKPARGVTSITTQLQEEKRRLGDQMHIFYNRTLKPYVVT
jgi:hypothetical protein